MTKLVRIEELVELTGLSVATLRRYQSQGMPVDGVPARGRASLYDAPAVLEWLIHRAVSERVIPSGDGAELDLDQERARLASAQADKVELEVAQMRRELIHMEEIGMAWERIGSALRARFMHLATRVGPDLFAAEDIETLIHRLHGEVLDVLGELQTDGVPKLTYDAGADDGPTVAH